MSLTKRRFNLRVWGLALGYFSFYAPYCALIKATTAGYLPGTGDPVKGFRLLPPAAIATAVVLLASTTIFGWWKYAGRRQLFGVSVIWPGRLVLLSGFGTAIIIGTTTLAYTFTGISILFALLLMRGGVLLIAPFVDFIFGRRVRWFSWVALALSLAALFLALADVRNYRMTLVAGLTIGSYLAGYLLRLPCINKLAKSNESETTYRYLVGEIVVATVVLVTLPAILAVIGRGSMMLELREGFTVFFSGIATLHGLMIGALYAGLYLFGTLIYLDARENTFCLPLNRGSSLLAGILATYVLSVLFAEPSPSLVQLTSSGLIIVALLVLSPLHHGYRVARRVRSSLGVAYRAFLDDFNRQSPVPVSLAQAAENNQQDYD
ncbi:MAG: hypothetical protein JO360_02870 [Acidobacteria bacterium]|nr:hypothetical protein [Acidobacteriota bacterium]